MSERSLLIVEDSAEDAEATVRALRKSGLQRPIERCMNGDEALDFLYRRGRYSEHSSTPLPCFILLDLNLPGTDGREVLADIKQNDELKTIPVVVVTTSTDDRDIDTCYRAGANSYIRKPVDSAGFNSAIQHLKSFWFEVTVLP